MEKTLVLIKPDAIRRGLVGEIYSRLEQASYPILRAELRIVPTDLAIAHYQSLRQESYFTKAVRSLGGKSVIAMVLGGENIIKIVRTMAGRTHPEDAEIWTIRGIYGRILRDGTYENVIHASKDKRAAEREIKLWFPDEAEVR